MTTPFAPRDDAKQKWEEVPDGGAPASFSVEPRTAPIPLHSLISAFPKREAFPLGTEVVRDYVVAIAEAYQVPCDLPAMMVPAVLGLTLSHVARIRLGAEWPQPPNLYTAVLMEPGNRKTGPFQSWHPKACIVLGISGLSACCAVHRDRMTRKRSLVRVQYRPLLRTPPFRCSHDGVSHPGGRQDPPWPSPLRHFALRSSLLAVSSVLVPSSLPGGVRSPRHPEQARRIFDPRGPSRWRQQSAKDHGPAGEGARRSASRRRTWYIHASRLVAASRLQPNDAMAAESVALARACSPRRE